MFPLTRKSRPNCNLRFAPGPTAPRPLVDRVGDSAVGGVRKSKGGTGHADGPSAISPTKPAVSGEGRQRQLTVTFGDPGSAIPGPHSRDRRSHNSALSARCFRRSHRDLEAWGEARRSRRPVLPVAVHLGDGSYLRRRGRRGVHIAADQALTSGSSLPWGGLVPACLLHVAPFRYLLRPILGGHFLVAGFVS
jgi:hypothetical protein